MEFTDSLTEKVPVQLDNGAIIKVEVASTGREDVAIDIRPFQEVTDALEGIVEAIAGTLQKVSPSKASVKFGLELAVESGKLTAVVVKGSSKANLEITLEWDK